MEKNAELGGTRTWKFVKKQSRYCSPEKMGQKMVSFQKCWFFFVNQEDSLMYYHYHTAKMDYNQFTVRMQE